MADITTKNITTVDEINTINSSDTVFVNKDGTLKQVSIENVMKNAPVSNEIDPTVPDWAKQESKPSYTADEVGALPSDTPIPSKLSDLTNDSGYITLDNIPEKLPNPFKLVFTGDIDVEYDGSEQKEVALPTKQSSLEKVIENYYALRRTGKVYQTKLWKFASNPTSAGEKLLDNEGLVFSP